MAEQHNHEHKHAQPMSHIEEALKKYNLDISDEQVSEAVKKELRSISPQSYTGI